MAVSSVLIGRSRTSGFGAAVCGAVSDKVMNTAAKNPTVLFIVGPWHREPEMTLYFGSSIGRMLCMLKCQLIGK